ncbi:MAG: hypothetical protein ACP5XB_00995 [Isosphaeraceae bacterium]
MPSRPDLDHVVELVSALALRVDIEPFNRLESGQRPAAVTEQLSCLQDLQVEAQGTTARARAALCATLNQIVCVWRCAADDAVLG